jgi:hypothetical protein
MDSRLRGNDDREGLELCVYRSRMRGKEQVTCLIAASA